MMPVPLADVWLVMMSSCSNVCTAVTCRVKRLQYGFARTAEAAIEARGVFC